jgi:SAM-dependent methyltransferase
MILGLIGQLHTECRTISCGWTMSRVDYDAIAHVYDEPRRDHPPDPGLEAFAGERGCELRGTMRVLDVGCGTGKQLASNHARFPQATLVGVDRSAGMLRVARSRERAVRWIHGDAQTLPLLSAAFDYATNQFSYPHIADKTRFVSEVFRVLGPGGRFVLTHIDPWAMPEWIVYRYFPDARAIDERDFLPEASLVRLLRGAGFGPITVTRTDRSQTEDLAAFLAHVGRRHVASQLMAISDGSYEDGLRRVRGDAAGGLVAVPSQFVILTIAADKSAERHPPG